MSVKQYIVGSLGEYLDCIANISYNTNGNWKKPTVLWFRGVENISHSLIPSLYRTNTRVERITNSEYSSMHYAEDIRTQHYSAKNHHFFTNAPTSRVEWLEVMQHHGVKTRVLDWSESSIHSLLFALENFLTDKVEPTRRQQSIPCVWVLNPQKLNKYIFDYIIYDKDGINNKLLKELSLNKTEEAQLSKRLVDYILEKDKFNETKETAHLDYIVNLNAINDELLRDRVRVKKMLLHGEIINPYYYFLTRIYSDGYILESRELPPLAVVQPYHSERIKAQKGVFTVFPFYEKQQLDDDLRKRKIEPDALNNNKKAQDCLYRIQIQNPQRVAYQLMANGMNDSWLYPEMPIVSNEIENHVIY